MDYKTLPIAMADLKFIEGESAFSGYASVFGGDDSHGDTIHPGAYTDVLAAGSTVKMYFNHGWLRGEMPIGKMQLEQDEIGLRVVRAEFTPGLPAAAAVASGARHGTIDGLSIGFRPDAGSTKRKASGGGRDIFKIAHLKEVSVVDWPSDGAARMTDVRSAIDDAASLKEIESLLREAGGFSRTDACSLVARIKSMAHGERGAERKQLAGEIRELFQHHVGG